MENVTFFFLNQLRCLLLHVVAISFWAFLNLFVQVPGVGKCCVCVGGGRSDFSYMPAYFSSLDTDKILAATPLMSCIDESPGFLSNFHELLSTLHYRTP